MSDVIHCPSCGRPNGPHFQRCLYCSTELPQQEGEPATEGSGGEDPVAGALDPQLLSSLPAALQQRLGLERGDARPTVATKRPLAAAAPGATTTAAPPPPPAEPAPRETPPSTPADEGILATLPPGLRQRVVAERGGDAGAPSPPVRRMDLPDVPPSRPPEAGEDGLVTTLPPALRQRLDASPAAPDPGPGESPGSPATPSTPEADGASPSDDQPSVDVVIDAEPDLPTISAEVPGMLSGEFGAPATSAAAPPSIHREFSGALDPYAIPEPVSIADGDSGDPDEGPGEGGTSDGPPARSGLLRGGGAFGPRHSVARVLLLPDPSYQRRIPWLRARLHGQLRLDAYSCNLYLQREFPVFLAGYPSEEEARTLGTNLADGGMRVLVLTRSMVEDYPPPFRAVAARLGHDAVEFADASGARYRVARRHVERAIVGEIHPPDAEDRPPPDRPFSGGLPRPGRSVDEVVSGYWALQLVVSPPGAPVLVRADEFDFECLGPHRGASSLINLRRLPEVVGSPRRPPVVDDLFKRIPRASQAAAPEGRGPGSTPTPEEVLFAEYAMIQAYASRVPAVRVSPAEP